MISDCTSHGTTTDTWTFTYDGDGVRVKEAYSGTGDSYTKYYFAGGAYEIEVVGETTTIKRYYSIAGMMVAMKEVIKITPVVKIIDGKELTASIAGCKRNQQAKESIDFLHL